MPATANPNISIDLSLDQFNHVQSILADRPFKEVADLILTFRRQVELQLERLRLAEEKRAPGLHLAPPPAEEETA